jgi:hypothetical protein
MKIKKKGKNNNLCYCVLSCDARSSTTSQKMLEHSGTKLKVTLFQNFVGIGKSGLAIRQ